MASCSREHTASRAVPECDNCGRLFQSQSGKKLYAKANQRHARLGNKIVWKNEDGTVHSVTTDNGFEDKINCKFDFLATIELIPPGKTFEFTFTEVGEYAYHYEPHPWMKGKAEMV